MRGDARVTAVGESVDLASASFSSGAEVGSFQSGLIECCSRQEMERFISARDSLPQEFRGFLAQYSLEEYVMKGARIFLTYDNLGGFSLPGGHHGDMLVSRAIEEGAQVLSCFDTLAKFSNLYERHGFRETFRAPWDDNLAPLHWNYAKWGRPDYVEMSL